MSEIEEKVSAMSKCIEDLQNEIHQLNKSVLNHKLVYSNQEVLKLFDTTQPTLRKWRNEGLLGYSQIGSSYFYSVEDIKRFLENHHFDDFAA